MCIRTRYLASTNRCCYVLSGDFHRSSRINRMKFTTLTETGRTFILRKPSNDSSSSKIEGKKVKCVNDDVKRVPSCPSTNEGNLFRAIVCLRPEGYTSVNFIMVSMHRKVKQFCFFAKSQVLHTPVAVSNWKHTTPISFCNTESRDCECVR